MEDDQAVSNPEIMKDKVLTIRSTKIVQIIFEDAVPTAKKTQYVCVNAVSGQ